MNEMREIGIEKEFFLLKKDSTLPIDERIIEPKIYEFPSDVFGFLVELRSEPWVHLNTVKMTWDMTKSYWEHRADKFGMLLDDVSNITVSRRKGKYFYNKYGGDRHLDYTKNIYGHKETHHLGMFFNTHTCRLTAGMHVHFSIRDSDCNVIEFTKEQIEEIVKTMDEAFKEDIEKEHRIIGEWEPKQHGFEYRSTPANTDVYKVLKTSFAILRKV